MDLNELKNKALSFLIPVYGEREAKNMIRILQEDILANRAVLTDHEISIWNRDIERLLKHEPLAYITGIAWFMNLKLKVSPAVLIPRPETEELADLVIKYIFKSDSVNVLDIGTGSGCLALAIKSSHPNTEVHAIDISDEALALAKHNADQFQLNISFNLVDIFDRVASSALPEQLDIIVSNPPYIMLNEKKLMTKSTLDYEPGVALFAGDTGLEFYQRIAEFGRDHLSNRGKIFVEINESLGTETVDTFKEQGYKEINLLQDLSGKDRFIVCEK